MRRSWKAETYKHFRKAEIARDPLSGKKQYNTKGHLRYRFICKKYVLNAHPIHVTQHRDLLILFRNPSKSIVRACTDNSTHNLRDHIQGCTPEIIGPSQMMKKFTSGCSYTRATFHVDILTWIANNCQPFSVVDDPELRSLFKTLHEGVVVPRPMAISADMKTFHSLCKDKVSNILRSYKGAIHIAFDAWTASNMLPFLGVTAHRCVDGKIETIILDFIRYVSPSWLLCKIACLLLLPFSITSLRKNHTGSYLEQELRGCLEEFGITNSVLALAGDNASNNDKLIDQFSQNVFSHPGRANRVRCFAHILNLAMQVCHLLLLLILLFTLAYRDFCVFLSRRQDLMMTLTKILQTLRWRMKKKMRNLKLYSVLS